MYGIRAASEITGVNLHTLRAWETRYGAFQTHRRGTDRSRWYSEETIERIKNLKTITHHGTAISAVAKESDEQLAKRADDIRNVFGNKAGGEEKRVQPDPRLEIAVDALKIGVGLGDGRLQEVLQDALDRIARFNSVRNINMEEDDEEEGDIQYH